LEIAKDKQEVLWEGMRETVELMHLLLVLQMGWFMIWMWLFSGEDV
jgi:hypothetical protein